MELREFFKKNFRRYAVKMWIWEILKFSLMVCIIFFVWSRSVSIMLDYGALKKLSGLSVSDLSALLFGASSIALFMVSVVLAGLTIFGWQAIIRGEIKKEVSRATEKRIQQLEHEMRGRVLNAMGYMVGETWPKEKAKLKVAVELLKQGYDEYLSKVEGPARFLGLNNLVYYSFLYYSCVRDEAPLSKEIVKDMLKNAQLLLKKSLEHDAINVQLTAGRVILEYSTKDEDKRRVEEVLKDLVGDKRLPEDRKKELEDVMIILRERGVRSEEGKKTPTPELGP